jgi:hypothetical protein
MFFGKRIYNLQCKKSAKELRAKDAYIAKE